MTDTVEKGFSTSAPLWTRGSDSSICTFWGKVRFSKWDPMGTRFYPFTVLSDVRAHFSTVSTPSRLCTRRQQRCGRDSRNGRNVPESYGPGRSPRLSEHADVAGCHHRGVCRLLW